MREFAFHLSTYHQKTGIIVKKDILTGKKISVTKNSKKRDTRSPDKKIHHRLIQGNDGKFCHK
jgi:hypothetical protein